MRQSCTNESKDDGPYGCGIGDLMLDTKLLRQRQRERQANGYADEHENAMPAYGKGPDLRYFRVDADVHQSLSL
jgi:hypothetical protein